jgi:hypothetical protein
MIDVISFLDLPLMTDEMTNILIRFDSIDIEDKTCVPINQGL